MRQESGYAAKLRVAVECDGWSINKLAKELAAMTGNSVETERSAIRGYLKDATPRPARARMIAEIMGVPELGVAENPRRSGVARLEDRLAAIAEANDELLAGQQKALLRQDDLLAELREIRAVLETVRNGRRAAPKQKAQ